MGGALIGRLFYEIGGDQSKLTDSLAKAMKAAEAANLKITRAGQGIIAAFDNALNPTKRLEEELKLLELAGKSTGDVMAVMGQRIKTATDTATANGQAIPDIVKKYAELGKETGKSTLSIESLGKSLTDFARSPVESAKAGIGGFLEKLGPTAVGLGGIATAAGLAGAAVFKMAADAGEAAEQLTNLSASTGLSLTDLQVFGQISEEMGLGVEGVTRAIEKLQVQLGRAEGGDFTNALAAYNIALKDNEGATRPVIDLLDEFRTKILAIEDPQRQAQVMAAAFNGRQVELQRLLLSSSMSLAEWKKALQDAGVIQTDEAIKKAAEFDDKLDKLGRKWKWLADRFKEGSVDIASAITDAFSGLFGGESGEFSFAAVGALGSAQRIKSPFDNTDKTQSILDGLAKRGGTGGDADAIARRAEENARLRAMQTGATKELAAAMADLAAEQEKFRNLEKTGSKEAREEQTQAIILAQRRVDKIKELQTESKRLADETRKSIAAIDEQLRIKLGPVDADGRFIGKGLGFSDIPAPPPPAKLLGFDPDELLAKQKELAKGFDALKPKVVFPASATQTNQEFFDTILKGAKSGEAELERLQKQFPALGPPIDEAARDAARFGEVWRNQVSTVFTDMSRDIAESIIEWKGWGESILDTLRSFAKGALRLVLEEFLNPLEKEFASLLSSGVKKLFGGGTGSGASAGGGMAASNWSWAGLGKSLGAFAPAGIATGSFAGLSSGNAYGKTAGIAGLGLLGGAGILGATSGAGFSASLGALALSGPLAPFIYGGLGAALGGVALYKLARGKNAWQAGGMEAGRDFGVDLKSKDFETWAKGLGLTESQTYPIRKDLMSSPLFLTQVAGPAAEAQGKMDDFLRSLEAVKTSWGTFNFRDAFELGDLTGDWSELDRVFKEAFDDSAALQKQFPDWQEKLLLGGEAAKDAAVDFAALFAEFQKTGQVSDEFQLFMEENATLLDTAAMKSSLLADQILQVNAALLQKPTVDGLKALKAALEADTTAASDMYMQFFETGEITEEFAAKIEELGGDLSRFEELSRLADIQKEFDDLADTFRETGEILPRLRNLFEEFGGDLAALDSAASLPGLYESLDSLEEFADGLERLLDTMSPIQQVLAGEWGADTWGELFKMGLDPSKFTGVTDLIKFTKDWDKARADFEKTGKLVRGGTLEQALFQFGGAEGKRALEQLRNGDFNTITPGLLDKTKAALDKAQKDELNEALDYLGEQTEKTNKEIDDLNATVEDQLSIVSKNITDALDASKTAVIAELDLMLAELKQIALNTAPAVAPITLPDTTGGGGGLDGTVDTSRDGGYENFEMAMAPANHFHFEGANFGRNAPEDVERAVEDALRGIRHRTGRI